MQLPVLMPAVLLPAVLLLAGCGSGWQALSQAGAIAGESRFTASIDQGTVSPAVGTVATGSQVDVTAMPPAGYAVSTYAIDGGRPVACAPAQPSPGGGDAVELAIAVTHDQEVISFQTAPVSAPPIDGFTVAIDQGSVSTDGGEAYDGSTIGITATPPEGFEVASYTIDDGDPIPCALDNPSPQGGDPDLVEVGIDEDGESIAFQTEPVVDD
jgi:hypothetical protein